MCINTELEKITALVLQIQIMHVFIQSFEKRSVSVQVVQV